jgi:hypothetical protein
MQPQPHPKFDVFLSHKSSDKEAIRDLKRRLEGEGLKCWLDEEQRVPGQRWLPLLLDALENSWSMLACVGPDGQGPWQKYETEYALVQAVESGKLLIPVFLPRSPDDAQLPLYIKVFAYVDFRPGFLGAELTRLVGMIKRVRKAQVLPESNQSPHGASSAAPLNYSEQIQTDQTEAHGVPAESERLKTEALRCKLNHTFPGAVEAIRKALAAGSPLKEVLVNSFKPRFQSEDGQAMEVLLGIYQDFLQFLEASTQRCKQIHDSDDRAKLMEFVSSILFLAMDPDFALQIQRENQKVDGAAILAPLKADKGIMQILGHWIQRRNKVDLSNLTETAADMQSGIGKAMNVGPHMTFQHVRYELLRRFGIQPSDPDADRRLEIGIELRIEINEPVAVIVEDRALLCEIQRPGSPLRKLLVFIRDPSTSIRPGAATGWFESSVENQLEALRKALSSQP